MKNVTPNNHVTHKAFLNHLKALLPSSVKPIIVTDAGFRAPWFSYIRSMGWDFVGRLRNKNLVLMENSTLWQLSHTFFERASSKPTYIGQGLLTKEGKVHAYFVVYKGNNKNRKKLTRLRKKSGSGKSIRYGKANNEPWVLVSSLTETNISRARS